MIKYLIYNELYGQLAEATTERRYATLPVSHISSPLPATRVPVAIQPRHRIGHGIACRTCTGAFFLGVETGAAAAYPRKAVAHDLSCHSAFQQRDRLI
jgi:hypothetical protein